MHLPKSENILVTVRLTAGAGAVQGQQSLQAAQSWLQGILALVAEIYSQDKLKLNLKFEIEMMFRNLNLQIGDAKPSSSLAKHKRQIINNADFTADKPMPPPQQAVVPEKQVCTCASFLIQHSEQGSLYTGHF